MFDFRNLVKKYSGPVTVVEETGGGYDYENGGKWMPGTQTRKTAAAVFNMTTKDIKSAIQYGAGGSYAREDVKVYIHEPLAIGAKLINKGKSYTVSTELDYADHAHGLRVYVARKAGEIENAEAEE